MIRISNGLGITSLRFAGSKKSSAVDTYNVWSLNSCIYPTTMGTVQKDVVVIFSYYSKTQEEGLPTQIEDRQL